MDDETFPVVCSNGCPEGYLGQHKFSCEWAGREGPRYPDVTVQLTGEDSNIFFIVGRVRATLRRAGHADQIGYFTAHVSDARTYTEALNRIGQWVTVR